MKNSLIILLTILAISCNSSKGIKKNEASIKRIWMLVAFKDFKKEDLVAKKAFVDFTETNRISAMMGCNNIGYDCIIKENNSLTFSNGMATEMYCDDMRLEKEFTKTIGLMNSYSVVGHKLTLTSKNGITMVFVAQDWD